MAREVKTGITFYPTVDTEFDLFNEASNFSLEIRNAATGDLVVNGATGTWSEIMWSDPGHSASVVGGATAGNNYIPIDSSSNTVVIGDRIDDGAGNIYYITDVANGNLYTKRNLKADIADGTSLKTVGNTGIYKVDVEIANEGEYLLDIAHPIMGHATVKYVVISHNLEDVYDRLDAGFNNLGDSLSMKVIA